MQKISLHNKKIFPDFYELHSGFHQHLRSLLLELNYLEVWCPPISTSPCFETHVHPFQISSCKDRKPINLFLHTSPEFILKKYLCHASSLKYKGLFSLNYVFRDDPLGSIHRNQFIMLEFYRIQSPIEKLLEDLAFLIQRSSSYLSKKYESLPIEKIDHISVNQLFEKNLNLSILDFMDPKELYKKICKDFPQNAPSEILPWDDLYNLLWLNYIEPKLVEYPAVLVHDFPAPVGLLAKSNPTDPRIKQRFELFIKGLEIANGYAEETSHQENLESLSSHLKEKKNIYQYELPSPDFFLNDLSIKGMMPSFGVAVGTERLLQTLTGLTSAFIDLE